MVIVILRPEALLVELLRILPSVPSLSQNVFDALLSDTDLKHSSCVSQSRDQAMDVKPFCGICFRAWPDRNSVKTHHSFTFLSLIVSVSRLHALSFQVGGSYAVAFLDTNPPQLVEVIPRLLSEFLDGPRASYTINI